MRLFLLPIKSLLKKLETTVDKDREQTARQVKTLKLEIKVFTSNVKTAFRNVWASVDDKMNTSNPTGSGSFSMNRKSGSTKGERSVAIGNNTTASGYSSHAEGDSTIASGRGSYATGFSTTASGMYSCAEGHAAKASEYCSHAEGSGTTASGSCSHAEGVRTIASGFRSHAEGSGTTASGSYSHAEGVSTIASGYSSHAEGDSTIASGSYSHAEGKYNIKDTDDKYVHIVGNGESQKRSNAHTLDRNGVGWFQGGLQVGGNAQDDGAKNVLLAGEAVPSPETAIVGQVMVVKAVDNTGKPTEWCPVDMPSGVGGGEWEKAVDMTLEAAGLIVLDDIDDSYKTIYGRLWIPKAGSTISFGNTQFLGSDLSDNELDLTNYGGSVSVISHKISETECIVGYAYGAETEMPLPWQSRSSYNTAIDQRATIRIRTELPVGTALVVYGKR